MFELSDDHWERIREDFPEKNIPDGRPGRKPIARRRVLKAVLWILKSGAQWHMLPQCYPNYKTVHRRFRNWCRKGALRNVLTDLANSLRDEGVIDERESFIDATLGQVGAWSSWRVSGNARQEAYCAHPMGERGEA